MSELVAKQCDFTLKIARLILYANGKNYGLTFGEGYDDDGVGHMKGSTHYVRLGQDFNLAKGGTIVENKSEVDLIFGLLHDQWDLMGGAERIAGDLGHFSFSYQGRR